MTPEEYIACVEALGREVSDLCWYGYWREYLENIHVKDGERRIRTECSHNNCKSCIPCKRCGQSYDSTAPMSRHGPAGDFVNWPEIYIADMLCKPWCNNNIIQYRPLHTDLLQPGAIVMTEEEILAGLKAVLEKYPNIIAWISMEPLYYACLARMPSVIALLTQWMERRNSFFTPAGEYAWMARAGMNYTDSDLAIGLRLDLPPIAREGEHNIPYYLVNKDFEAGDINLAHAIHSILMLKETPAEFVGIYARALASNTKMWQSIECASMNNYPILSNFIRCISHCVKKDETKITITPQRWAGNTPVVHELPARLVWHTLGTRCSLCVLDTHEGHTQYCDTCLPATPVDPVPKSPYETAIAEAAAIRRRRLRGILRCAAILVGKARLIHFVPPFGQKYLEAKARFEANSAL